MQLNDKGEVIFEPVNKEVVKTYNAGIAWHLHCENVIDEKESSDERR